MFGEDSVEGAPQAVLVRRHAVFSLTPLGWLI